MLQYSISNQSINDMLDDGFDCDQPECNVHHANNFKAPVEAEYASQPLTMDIDIPCGDVWCKNKANRIEVKVSPGGMVYTHYHCERHTSF